MKRITLTFLFLLAMITLAVTCSAQITILGHLTTAHEARATITHASDGNTYDIWMSRAKMDKATGLYKHRYNLPWALEKGYLHAINFDNGEHRKTIIVRGYVPEGVHPRQRIKIDVKLGDQEHKHETLIVFYSQILGRFHCLPDTEMAEIKRLEYQPRPHADPGKYR